MTITLLCVREAECVSLLPERRGLSLLGGPIICLQAKIHSWRGGSFFLSEACLFPKGHEVSCRAVSMLIFPLLCATVKDFSWVGTGSRERR